MAERIIRIVIDPGGAQAGARRVQGAVAGIGRSVNSVKERIRRDSASSARSLGTIAAGTQRLRGALATRVPQAIFNSIRTGARRARSSVAALTARLGSLRTTIASATSSTAGQLLSLYTLYRTVGALRDYADTWRNTTNQLKVVTSTTRALVRVQGQLLHLAAETFSAYEPTVELYTRLSRSLRAYGISQERVVRATRTINQAIFVGGSTAQEASAGVIQFGQALASSRLSGDELRSVLEQMPRLARALAEGLGVGIGELRTLGEAGKLTTEVVFGAIEESAGKIADEFSELTPTYKCVVRCA